MSSSQSVFSPEILRMLNNTPYFAGFNFHEHRMILNKCIFQNVEANKVVIRQGDIGDCLYIIVKGQVEISIKKDTDYRVKIATLGIGEAFGEIAILRKIPRTAFVTTCTPCTFLTIKSADFLKMYQYFSVKSCDNIQLLIEKRLAGLKR
jgi:CRP-like cAMP-binding protein